MKTFAIYTAGIAILAAPLTWLIDYLFATDGISLGFHGALAIYLCLVIVPSLGIGLMHLAHVSDRSGVDAEVSDNGRSQDDRGNPR
jgi:hypothetical protein